MKTKNSNTTGLINQLNVLLSSYQVTFFNIRASHWMIKGENFFELHKVFETAYNDANEKIDAIAERILTLGGTPLLTAAEMLKLSAVPENAVNGDQEKCVQAMLSDLKRLSEIETEVVKLAEDEDDIVTADLVTGYLGQQQKVTWMLSQFLNKRSSIVK